MPRFVLAQVEYAGFQYIIVEDDDVLKAIPEAGQHSAAWKEKHRRAAIEFYKEGLEHRQASAKSWKKE